MLQSCRTGFRRRRSLFRIKKNVFSVLETYLASNVKRFKYLATKTNSEFESIASSFYNNISFLVYRLGFVGTITAGISAVSCHWFV